MKFKQRVLTGLATLLPTVLTVTILVLSFQFVSRYVGKPAGRIILSNIAYVSGVRLEDMEERLPWFYPLIEPLIGVLLVLLAVYFSGWFVTSIVGTRVFRVVENNIAKVPIVRVIYPYAKQFSEFIFSEKRFELSTGNELLKKRIVAVPFPRKGVYALGFLTSDAKAVLGREEEAFVTVFVPTSPWPVTGYVMMFPREDVKELDITLDQAIRFIMTGGVVTPDTAVSGKINMPGADSKTRHLPIAPLDSGDAKM